jgi:hypothetical protein
MGNASESAERASVLKRPTYMLSITLYAAWTVIDTTEGIANLTKRGNIGSYPSLSGLLVNFIMTS